MLSRSCIAYVFGIIFVYTYRRYKHQMLGYAAFLRAVGWPVELYVSAWEQVQAG